MKKVFEEIYAFTRTLMFYFSSNSFGTYGSWISGSSSTYGRYRVAVSGISCTLGGYGSSVNGILNTLNGYELYVSGFSSTLGGYSKEYKNAKRVFESATDNIPF